VLLPLFISTKRDYYDIIHNGEAFYESTMDMLESHKNKYYKTASSFLLQKLISKYVIYTNIVYYVLKLADACITSNYSNTPECEVFIKTYTPEQNIDMCLIVLCVMSNEVIKNKPTLLRSFFDTHLNTLLSVNSILIKNRLCLFFGLYLDTIYTHAYTESISTVIEFLFQQLFLYKEASGVAFQAANALNSLISHKHYSLIISDIIKKMIMNLVNSIKEIEVNLFFDVLLDVILYLDIEDHVLFVFREVTQRILKEVKSVQPDTTSESKYNLYISKCFKVLIAIVDKYSFSNLKDKLDESSDVQVIIETATFELSELEKIIQPLVLYIKNPMKIYFDNELISLLTMIIRNSKEITEFMKDVFTYLPKYVSKHSGINKDLFELVSVYIQYGNDFFTDDHYRTKLLNLIKSGLQDEFEIDESPVYAALLARLCFEVIYLLI
jgi:hypothetical protein